MAITTIDAARTACVRVLRTVALLAAAVTATAPSSAWADIYHDAFGQELSIPRSVPSGVVLARHYIAPAQACGQSKCTVTAFVNYPDGGGGATGTTTITTNVSGLSTRLLINGHAYASQQLPAPVTFTQPLEVQLLSDGRKNTGGSLAGTYTNPAYYRLDVQEIGSKLWVRLKGMVTSIDGTCSVPAQTVTLPTAWTNKFGDVGSTLGTQSFQIRINNCPKGYNRIGYTLDPRGGVIENAPGVLPLAADSTASGVKIRVADDKGVPVAFGTSIKVDAYNKTTGGSYAIPMQASYIKTDATIKPGIVNGAMTVLLDYQ
ncbi:fimbrial protein [Burkholderia territorii]|uniref:fimbrial protein n=1 Tax=Burkholderia territorii TaxID=1503055 RepID=UPI0007530334|nr:fimbrial protein [Burkholderia territorii]KVQ50332.1 fimbrial protein [Burkholderia territorii]